MTTTDLPYHTRLRDIQKGIVRLAPGSHPGQGSGNPYRLDRSSRREQQVVKRLRQVGVNRPADLVSVTGLLREPGRTGGGWVGLCDGHPTWWTTTSGIVADLAAGRACVTVACPPLASLQGEHDE